MPMYMQNSRNRNKGVDSVSIESPSISNRVTLDEKTIGESQ